MPLDHLASLLEDTRPDIDAATLSRHAFARLQPELQRRAVLIGWRRVAVGVLLALLPLPFVLAYNAYFLRLVYGYLSALLPATIAAYLVLSYAASLLLLFAATYAAIPVLLVGRRSRAAALP
ncbi:MAG TPA: hypothetical protein VMW56_20910 [Candidatus Margulisiibacteriota bacterium]|nr:hypothetical protein [Candidatus Margulisiibacteriota bacterium]